MTKLRFVKLGKHVEEYNVINSDRNIISLLHTPLFFSNKYVSYNTYVTLFKNIRRSSRSTPIVVSPRVALKLIRLLAKAG